MAVIVPAAKAVYLCKRVGQDVGLTNLHGLFNSFTPRAYPYTRRSFCVFAQLSGGLGSVPFRYDIRRASDDRLVGASAVRVLNFRRRTQLLQVATAIEHVVFPTPGVYFIELWCENTWVADVTLELRGVQP